jgi:hypothetical protein
MYLTPILNNSLIIPKIDIANHIVFQCLQLPLPSVHVVLIHPMTPTPCCNIYSLLHVVLRAHMLHGDYGVSVLMPSNRPCHITLHVQVLA